MDLESTLRQVRERYDEINQAMADPAIYDRPDEYRELTLELNELMDLMADIDRWLEIRNNLEGNREMIEADEDAEISEMARLENVDLQTEREELETEIKYKLFPKDPDDSRNCIVEIRAGTGGVEAALFSGDLFEMYRSYVESRGWM